MAKALIESFDREVAALLGRLGNGRAPGDEQRLVGAQGPATNGVAVTRSRWSPARLAYWFYGVAAAGAVLGQTWVAVGHLPWGSAVPFWVRVVAVLPFAVCLELLAMALAALADERLRLGERAYGFRTFSAAVAVVAVGIQVVGHWPDVYWSGVFGVLSSSAYLLWLLHSAARRRDALRAAGKLADTAPDYGLWRRVRHPVWTARAAELARQGRVDGTNGRWRALGLFESLQAAQLVMADEKRRPAIAGAVEQVVRADKRDPQMAEVAVRTLDLDRLAAELAGRVDYSAWADRLAPAVAAPAAIPAVSGAIPSQIPAVTAAIPSPDAVVTAAVSSPNAVVTAPPSPQPPSSLPSSPPPSPSPSRASSSPPSRASSSPSRASSSPSRASSSPSRAASSPSR
ncbi:MAG: hypothetical protein QOE51_1088, partial [Actinoplanes sp.]|nr:hypothetical protein [Actinoplanes sp.]